MRSFIIFGLCFYFTYTHSLPHLKSEQRGLRPCAPGESPYANAEEDVVLVDDVTYDRRDLPMFDSSSFLASSTTATVKKANCLQVQVQPSRTRNIWCPDSEEVVDLDIERNDLPMFDSTPCIPKFWQGFVQIYNKLPTQFWYNFGDLMNSIRGQEKEELPPCPASSKERGQRDLPMFKKSETREETDQEGPCIPQ